MSNVAHILDDIEYLVPLISYLGSNPYWWARSAPSLAKELSLDAERVQRVFERHPMIFLKARYIKESNAFSYALQMRYAQRSDGETDLPPQVSAFPVLSEARVIALHRVFGETIHAGNWRAICHAQCVYSRGRRSCFGPRCHCIGDT